MATKNPQKPEGSRGFKSPSLHTSVFRVSDMAENRSQSARVRAICDHARTRRTPPGRRIARIWQNLSGRDFARSADHRFRFACRTLAEALEISAFVRMRKCVSLNAREVVSRVEPGEFALDELVNLGSDPFGIIERSDANGEIATFSHERMIRRRIFAVQPCAARSSEKAAPGIGCSILGRRSFRQSERVT